MASGTSDLIVRLSLDTTQFEGSLSKFEGQMTKLQASCTNAATGMSIIDSVRVSAIVRRPPFHKKCATRMSDAKGVIRG